MLFLLPTIQVVVELTNETMLDLKGSNLIKFYAPWCGHCKTLAPKFEELAEQVSNVTMTQLDCTKYKDICEANNIMGFPTIKFFHDGAIYDYQGEREVEPIKKWMIQMTLPALIYRTQQELEQQRNELNIPTYYILYTNDIQKHEKLFQQFKDKLVISAEPGDEKLVAVRENVTIQYKNNLNDQKQLQQFLSVNNLPFCSHATPELMRSLLDTYLPITSISVDVSNSSKIVDQFCAVPLTTELATVFTVIDNAQFKQLIDIFNGDNEPTLYIIIREKVYGRKLDLEKDYSQQINQLHDDINQKKIEPIELKKPENMDNDESPQNLIKIVNTIIFAAIGLAGIFAIWFACKCMKSNKQMIEEEDDEDTKQNDNKKED